MDNNEYPATKTAEISSVIWAVISVIMIGGIFLVLYLRLFPKHPGEPPLKQLYTFLTIYADAYHCYPSMQPTNVVTRLNAGVRDLYPLYLMAENMKADEKAFLSLLQPPSVKLLPFSKNPSPDEFDSAHIGYIYNSAVVPDQSNNVPLMAERCVEDGMFTTDEKPVFKDCAHILMANGSIKWVPVENGKLILGDIRVEDLGRLK